MVLLPESFRGGCSFGAGRARSLPCRWRRVSAGAGEGSRARGVARQALCWAAAFASLEACPSLTPRRLAMTFSDRPCARNSPARRIRSCRCMPLDRRCGVLDCPGAVNGSDGRPRRFAIGGHRFWPGARSLQICCLIDGQWLMRPAVEGEGLRRRLRLVGAVP